MLSQMKRARTGLVAPLLLALLCGSALADKPLPLLDPEGLTTSDITDTSIKLTWQPVGDQDGFIVGYLENDLPEPECATGTTIDVGTATSWVVDGLIPGTEYGFRVCAYSFPKTSDGATLFAETTGGTSPPSPYPDYVLTRMGTLGGQHSHANALNDNGDTVGWSNNEGQEQLAMLWTKLDGMIDLNTLIAGGWPEKPDSDWVLTEAWDINNAGHIVGVALVDGQERAFRLRPLADLYVIDDLHTEGCLKSAAHGINTFGHVTGYRYVLEVEPGYPEAFLYTDDAGIVPIPPLAPEMGIVGRDINSSCQITGDGSVPDRKITYKKYAFLYDSWSDTTINLGTFVEGAFNTQSDGKAINDAGAVAGWANTARRGFHVNRAFIYTDETGMVDQGTLGGDGSEAWDINNSGNIVGHSGDATGTVHPFLKYPNSDMISLNDLIVSGSEVFRLSHNIAINEMNEVATTIIADDVDHYEAVILEPVSE